MIDKKQIWYIINKEALEEFLDNVAQGMRIDDEEIAEYFVQVSWFLDLK